MTDKQRLDFIHEHDAIVARAYAGTTRYEWLATVSSQATGHVMGRGSNPRKAIDEAARKLEEAGVTARKIGTL